MPQGVPEALFFCSALDSTGWAGHPDEFFLGQRKDGEEKERKSNFSKRTISETFWRSRNELEGIFQGERDIATNRDA